MLDRWSPPHGEGVAGHGAKFPCRPGAVLLVAIACLSSGSGIRAAEDAQLELAEVLERLNALDSWLDDAGSRIAAQEREVAEADRGIAAASKQIRELDARIEGTRQAIEQLRGDGERLDDDRQHHLRRVAAHLREAWRFAQRDPLQALLNQEDPQFLDRMKRYHAALADARTRLVSELRDTTDSLRDNERELNRQRLALQEARRSSYATRTGLVDARGKRQGLVAALRSDLAEGSRERERLSNDRQRLESLIAELARTAVASPADPGVAPARGELPWPVEGSVDKQFGQSRAGGRMRWQGITLRAPVGSDVRAVAGGRVAFADWLRGFGLLAIIDHGGWMSLYGFVDAIYKRRGDPVEPGEAIASVGQSGGQAEVGLYFEIREDGEPVDPFTWLLPRAAGGDR